MIPIPAIPAALQNQLVEVGKAIYVCSKDKRFGDLFSELLYKIEFITSGLENFKAAYNPEMESKLKNLLNELNDILTWIHDLKKQSVLNRIVKLKKTMFGIVASNLKSASIQDLTARGMENLEVSLKEGFQAQGNSIDQVMANLGVYQTNIVDNQEAITKIIKDQLLVGFNQPMKELLDHLQQKSGRAVKSAFLGLTELRIFVQHLEKYHGAQDKTVLKTHPVEREFQLWYNLKPHLNVVPLLGACLNTDKPFFVMPFFQHGDVFSFVLKTPNTSMKARVGFILDIAYAMNHLHYFNIVHGDLKGDNVLVSHTDGKFHCAISDFGLSYLKVSAASNSIHQRTEAVRWIAPERYKRGSKVTGEMLDVFAFAMTSYQILAGKLPFSEEPNDEVVKEWIKDGERPDKLENIPAGVWSVISDCWAQNPIERPAFGQITSKLQKEYKNITETKPSGLNTKSLDGKDESSTACNSPSATRARSNSNRQSQSPRFAINAINLFAEASSSLNKTIGAMSSTFSSTLQSFSKPVEASNDIRPNIIDSAKVNPKSIKIAKAKCQYIQQHDNEMSYNKGDCVCIVDPRSAMWKAFRFSNSAEQGNRRMLVVDSNNFELVQEKSVFSIETPFYKSKPGELQLYRGDQIEILENTLYDGWVKAKNIENGQTGMTLLNIIAQDAITTVPAINIQDFSTDSHITYEDRATPLYLEKNKNRWRLSTNVIHESREERISEGSSMHFVVSSDFGSFEKFNSSIDLKRGDVIAVTKVFEDRLTVQNLTTKRSGSIRTNLSSLSALKINEWETLEVTVVEIVNPPNKGEKALVLSKKDPTLLQVYLLTAGSFSTVHQGNTQPIIQEYQFRFVTNKSHQPKFGNEELAVAKGDIIMLKNVFEDGYAFATNINTTETGMINLNQTVTWNIIREEKDLGVQIINTAKDVGLSMISLLVSGAFCLVSQKRNTATAGRVINVVNNCAAPVTLNFISGAIGYRAGLNQCNSDGDCLDGGSCNLQNHICFFKQPQINGGKTLNQGQSNQLTFPFYNNEGPVWSGNIEGCTGATCGSNGINKNPNTAKAEFTLQRRDLDFYDITVIDGFTIPMEMRADVPDSVLTSDPYFCTNPGSQSPRNSQLGVCNWNQQPPTPYQLWVSGDRFSPSCSADRDCQSGLKCGIPSQTPGYDPSNDLHCGQLLGYWSPEKACGNNQCGMNLGSPNNGFNLGVLFGCTNGIPSCYQDAAHTNQGCCGCQNWNQVGIKVPGSTQQCTFVNPNWTNLVLPYLKWMKQSCPTSYVYPYDDKSSTFVCAVYQQGIDPFHPSANTNNVQYTVTLCPGNSKIVR
ncbi:hypothetical protein HDV01_005501 [Terramyces sp. JEL0728]|nr:hypothetical protein HDV01_005501 [Terramyces sp. JEL0728]